jgi:hypothetical protein
VRSLLGVRHIVLLLSVGRPFSVQVRIHTNERTNDFMARFRFPIYKSIPVPLFFFLLYNKQASIINSIVSRQHQCIPSPSSNHKVRPLNGSHVVQYQWPGPPPPPYIHNPSLFCQCGYTTFFPFFLFWGKKARSAFRAAMGVRGLVPF